MIRGFEGVYYRHQKGNRTFCVIAGRGAKECFIQVITDSASHMVTYPLDRYLKGDETRIGDCTFSLKGISLSVQADGLSLSGTIAYSGLTTLKSDIMGPLRFVPLLCRHGIISMRHDTMGGILLNGETMDFNGGFGYIESDCGTSFPESYLWLHCRDAEKGVTMTAACAKMNVLGIRFNGFFVVMVSKTGETRFTSYLGGRVLAFNERGFVVRQGRQMVSLAVEKGEGHTLLAPEKGHMTRAIKERAACPVTVRVMDGRYETLRLQSENAAFEFV